MENNQEKLEILPLTEGDEKIKRRQTVEKPKGAIVLVHGICHGAWCWNNFLNFFADHEYQGYAISLPGHGKSDGKERLQEYTLSYYVKAVKSAMKTIKTDMEKHGLKDVKPFLLGHSMGGAVVQQYIGKYEEDVQGAVLFAPATAPKMKIRDILPKNKHLWYATLIAWDSCDSPLARGASRKQIVHDAAFFSSKGKGEDGKTIITQRVKDTSRYELLLQAESKKVTGGMSALLKAVLLNPPDLTKKYSDKYHVQIPVLVIGSRADLYFGLDSLKQTADKYAKNDTKTSLVPLESLCHDMMLDDYEPKAWEKSAKPVLSFVENSIDFVNNPENHWPRDLH